MNIKLDIPEKFFEGEERCGYYVSPEMKKVWAVQLDLLAEFSRVCEKNNLRWFMDAGTLLGAARHKGFIPWDHDVDVMMMREDYERLLTIAPKEFQHPYSFLQLKEWDPGVYARFMNEDTTMILGGIPRIMQKDPKLRNSREGIFLDVFPVDNLPDDNIELKRLIRKTKIRNYITRRIFGVTEGYNPHLMTLKNMVKSFMHYFAKKMHLSYKPFLQELEDTIKLYSNNNTKRLGKLCMIWYRKFEPYRVWNRSDFQNTVYLPFEMLTLPAPSGWENILNIFYGDWHKFVIREDVMPYYDTERPYTYYTQEGHIPQ